MVKGVTEGFERKLELQGVGYRGQVQGKSLILKRWLSVIKLLFLLPKELISLSKLTLK